MIDREDLLREIERCQRDPVTALSIDRLASLYTVYDHLFAIEKSEGAKQTRDTTIHTIGDSDFLKSVRGKNQIDVMRTIDELMDVLHAINPRLYDQVMDRIK